MKNEDKMELEGMVVFDQGLTEADGVLGCCGAGPVALFA